MTSRETHKRAIWLCKRPMERISYLQISAKRRLYPPRVTFSFFHGPWEHFFYCASETRLRNHRDLVFNPFGVKQWLGQQICHLTPGRSLYTTSPVFFLSKYHSIHRNHWASSELLPLYQRRGMYDLCSAGLHGYEEIECNGSGFLVPGLRDWESFLRKQCWISINNINYVRKV